MTATLTLEAMAMLYLGTRLLRGLRAVVMKMQSEALQKVAGSQGLRLSAPMSLGSRFAPRCPAEQAQGKRLAAAGAASGGRWSHLHLHVPKRDATSMTSTPHRDPSPW